VIDGVTDTRTQNPACELSEQTGREGAGRVPSWPEGQAGRNAEGGRNPHTYTGRRLDLLPWLGRGVGGRFLGERGAVLQHHTTTSLLAHAAR
jgi:hypothetical protein